MLPTASCLSRMNLSFKQRLAKKQELGGMSMNFISFDVPLVKELMKSPLTTFITFSVNDCGSSGNAKQLIVNLVHQLFLKAKAVANKVDNPTLWEAMHIPNLQMNSGKQPSPRLKLMHGQLLIALKI